MIFFALFPLFFFNIFNAAAVAAAEDDDDDDDDDDDVSFDLIDSSSLVIESRSFVSFEISKSF